MSTPSLRGAGHELTVGRKRDLCATLTESVYWHSVARGTGAMHTPGRTLLPASVSRRKALVNATPTEHTPVTRTYRRSKINNQKFSAN